MPSGHAKPSRRDLLSLIGAVAGSAAMYQAMTSLGFAAESGYKGPIKLEGDPKGASVLVLGAGLGRHDRGAGIAQRRLQSPGAGVQQPAGRPQLDACAAATASPNSAASRRTANSSRASISIPAHGAFPITIARILDYCKRLSVTLEPFIQVNHNACLHSVKAFGGKPQRIRDIKADFRASRRNCSPRRRNRASSTRPCRRRTRRSCCRRCRSWGALDRNYAYKASLISADFRGYAKDPGGGLGAAPVAGEPLDAVGHPAHRGSGGICGFALPYEFQTTMFQPVGGMDMIGKAFAARGRRPDPLQRQGHPDPAGRSRRHRDLCRLQDGGAPQTGEGRLVRLHHSAVDPQPDPDRCRRADEGGHRRGALRRVGQDRPAVQAPLLGRGRGDLWRHQLHRPADPADRLSEHRDFNRSGKGVLLGAYAVRRRQRLRIRRDAAGGAHRARGRIWRHASTRNTGPSSRTASPWPGTAMPCTLGCAGNWTDEARGSSITTISARSTAGSCWRASMPRTFRPGRRARSSRRSTPSPGCTSAWSKRKAMSYAKNTTEHHAIVRSK